MHDLGEDSNPADLSLTSACSASAPSAVHSTPGLRLLPLFAWPVPVQDLPLSFWKWNYDTRLATACIVSSRPLSSGLAFSSRRMMKMKILPLEYLTVTFSSKMATSEQRHDLSCQSVSTSSSCFHWVWGLSADNVTVGSSKQSRTSLPISPLTLHTSQSP